MQVKSVVIIYTSQNNKPLHHVVGSPMNPHYGCLPVLSWIVNLSSLGTTAQNIDMKKVGALLAADYDEILSNHLMSYQLRNV